MPSSRSLLASTFSIVPALISWASASCFDSSSSHRLIWWLLVLSDPGGSCRNSGASYHPRVAERAAPPSVLETMAKSSARSLH